MKKTLVASALAAVIFVPSASAIEIYKDNENAVGIGGWIDAKVITTQGETDVSNGSTRINFNFTRQLTHDWKAFSKLEWAVNMVGNTSVSYKDSSTDSSGLTSSSSEFLTNRLGYVGLSNDTYGSVAIGKQWGVWYDVVYNTNLLGWDGNTSGTYSYNAADGSVNGTGRADKAVQYRNAFGDFSFAVQAQLKQNSYETNTGTTDNSSLFVTSQSVQQLDYYNTYGISMTYQLTDNIVLTAGGNQGEFDAWTGSTSVTTDWTKNNYTDSIYGAGATYGNWNGEGFYAAANINQQRYHDTDPAGRLIPEAVGLESLFSYKFENGLRPLVAYNVLKADSSYGDDYSGDTFKREFLVVGLHYVWTPKTVVYIEARKDLSDSSSSTASTQTLMNNDESDAVAIGVRYYL
ncbi:porin [Shewanella surugensis]|uniref:Porin n=1 Tax=Shewanella surugensis TaxID=212020 RepID=A0ABT0L8A8_9GAMM|nr:porin [Shewanella surugensis]MCL1123911.1 porin [Shewanella surugensis]